MGLVAEKTATDARVQVKRMRSASAAFVLVALWVPIYANPAVLEVHGARVSIDRTSGDVVSVQAHGIEMLARPSRQWIVRLTDPSTRQSQWLDSGHAGALKVTVRTGEIRVRSTLRNAGVTVEVLWKRDTAAGGITVRCSVSAPPRAILESVTCPVLKLRAAVGGDSSATRLFMPGGDGFIATHTGMVKNPWAGRTYPGWASMQFMALYGARGGLTVQGRDPQALPKAFEAPYEAASDTAEMRIVHQLPFVVSRACVTPSVLLASCGSSWQSAADTYKRWARRQSWARRKTGDAAPPSWLNTGLITMGGHLRPFGIGKLPVEPDQWPDVVRSLKSAFGAPGVLLDLREWEHDGIYTSPFYFPLYPSDDELKRILASVRPLNARATAMVSGLQWMIERKAYRTDTYNVTAFDGKERFEREGRAVCVVNRDGQMDIAEPYFTWDGTKARMCPAHPFTRAHFPATARRLAEAGFAIFEFDQMNGGQCPPCYSRDHGHEPGHGPWMREAIARFMAATRKAGRAVSREFATSIEDPCEVYLPHLDSYISRAGHTSEWPANGEGTEAVPAFAYVYNPLARPLCVDIQHSVNPDPYQLILTARAFAGGCIPSTNLGLFGIYHKYGKDDLLPTPEKLDPDQRTLLAAVTHARCGPLLRFINGGEMVSCDAPDVPDRIWRHQVWEKDRMVEKALIHPPVLARAWRLGTEMAFAFVNIADEPIRIAVGWRAGETPLPPTSIADVWENGRQTRAATLGAMTGLELPAQSVVSVIVQGRP
jgi:hypothetical protein